MNMTTDCSPPTCKHIKLIVNSIVWTHVPVQSAAVLPITDSTYRRTNTLVKTSHSMMSTAKCYGCYLNFLLMFKSEFSEWYVEVIGDIKTDCQWWRYGQVTKVSRRFRTRRVTVFIGYVLTCFWDGLLHVLIFLLYLHITDSEICIVAKTCDMEPV